MCWLGRCAVLGGTRRGWTRCGAGVTKDAPSSCRYDDVSVGDPGTFSTRPSVLEVAADFLSRGRGLPSSPAPGSPGRGLRELRTGVRCESRSADRGWGDPVGETFRFRTEVGSLAAMSFGPDVM
jgi:hypothetical protein